MAAFVIVI